MPGVVTIVSIVTAVVSPVATGEAIVRSATGVPSSAIATETSPAANGAAPRATSAHRTTTGAPGIGCSGSSASEPGTIAASRPGWFLPARRRRCRAEVERVGPESRIVGDAREREPRRRVLGRGAARVLGKLDRAIAHDLDETVGPDDPYGVGSVLQFERHDRRGRRHDERAPDDEPPVGRDRVRRASRPAPRPAPGARAVAGLEPDPGERPRRVADSSASSTNSKPVSSPLAS